MPVTWKRAAVLLVWALGGCKGSEAGSAGDASVPPVADGGGAGNGGAGPSGGTSGEGGVAMGGAGSPADASVPPPAADPCSAAGTCPPNTWVNVTPADIAIPMEGLRSVVADPVRPGDLYMTSGTAGIWKTTDYGNHWNKAHQGFGYVAQGLCLAVLPNDSAATLLIAAACDCGKIHKSTDGAVSFHDTGGGLPGDLYSFQVDPYDGKHVISGFHEKDGVAESRDGGDTWHVVMGSGFPGGGVSWYPFFVDTGSADTTARTWLAIAQNGGSPALTKDGGATWTIPDGVKGLVHPHGNAQIFQRGPTIFLGGGGGPSGDGVYRSNDYGATFTKVSKATPSAIVWGTPRHVYSMFSWSCFNCPIDPNFMVGSESGDTWANPGVPKAMLMGADHVSVVSDGQHRIFVAAMRNAGLWRFVEE